MLISYYQKDAGDDADTYDLASPTLATGSLLQGLHSKPSLSKTQIRCTSDWPWAAGESPTTRYPHGMLSYDDHIAFLRTRHAHGLSAGLKAAQASMRKRYPGWCVSLKSIDYALRSKPEWNDWCRKQRRRAKNLARETGQVSFGATSDPS